jgi:hypothetical protein
VVGEVSGLACEISIRDVIAGEKVEKARRR